ncbi:hypothetical protein MNBD_GAMMA23-1327 [hydrothermal vent metagenome]|uniref:Radical SAM core domain-containing protein n=1 Tax=hydrothermal vent metagenome TaxID=652676 RepID=A0A3B1AVG4_9ZZZZ
MQVTQIMNGSQLSATAANTQNIAYALHGNCYINMTNRCTLRCSFCPKFNKQWAVKGYLLRLKSEPETQEILTAIGDPTRYKEIVFCGLGEPTLRLKELLSIATQLKLQGTKIRLNTDGLANAIYKKDITPLLKNCIDAISVSLNSHDEKLYEEHCRPLIDNAFNAVQEFVRAAREHVDDITVTAIDGLQGNDILACKKIASNLGVKFRYRILDEVG